MEHADDKEVQNLCREKLKTITASGKVSYTVANNAFNFYQLLKMNGFDEVKGRYSNSQFHKLVKSLVDVGIPKALLQNLGKGSGRVIPMVDIVKIDFYHQAPVGYVPPNSLHKSEYDHFINRKSKLRLVA